MNPSSTPHSALSAMQRVLGHRLPRTLLLVGLVVLVPALFHTVAWLYHATNYTGTCGPHAPDIAAHPCAREVYNAEFDAGFQGLALMMVEAMLGMLVLLVGSVGWVVFDRRAHARRPRNIAE